MPKSKGLSTKIEFIFEDQEENFDLNIDIKKIKKIKKQEITKHIHIKKRYKDPSTKLF